MAQLYTGAEAEEDSRHRGCPRWSSFYDRGGGGGTFLAEVGLALLDGGHDHVPARGGGQAVEAGAPAHHGDDVQVLGARVVGAVEDGAHGQAQGHAELVAGGASAAPLGRHGAGGAGAGGFGGGGRLEGGAEWVGQAARWRRGGAPHTRHRPRAAPASTERVTVRNPSTGVL